MPTGSIGASSDMRLSAVFDPEPDAQAAPDPLLGMVIGGVRLVRVIGQGGMGKVYEGEQQKPRFTVAVKVMRPGLATPEMRKRFEYEAEILARLRHPGIAQIFSAGVESVLGAPVPYFVMEYIPGARTLTDYADALKLPTRARLDLFRSVCEAVAHGHQKGVVHRDLKPGNILVDADGSPKVIDFGVAKATDSDLSLTSMHSEVGQLIGTLQYMGPEQMDGNPNLIDIRCDVYALGVVLYELLTGHLPYNLQKKAILEAMRIVKQDNPTPISAFDRTLRRDIAVIAGKCLEKEPTRRYVSASALGEDVGRYLAGEPIKAKAQSFVDGVLRLARKHRAAAAATAATFVALVAAVIGILAFALKAEAARKEAENARATAVKSRAAAERLVEFMTFNLHEKLQPIGRLELMREVLKKLERYHEERVLLEKDGQETLKSEDFRNRVAFWDRMGDLLRSMGDLAAARERYEKALAMLETLAARNPTNAQWQRDLAVVHDKLGDLASATGDLAAARVRYTKAFAIKETLAAQDAKNTQWQRDLAFSHSSLGDFASATGDLAAAREHHEKALAIMETIAAQDLKNAQWQRDLAVGHTKVGDLARAAGDLTATREQYRKAFAIREILTKQDPRNTQRQRDLAVSHRRLGDLAHVTGDLTAAQGHCEKAVAIIAILAAQDPRNAQWQWDLAASHNELGELQSATGDLAATRKHHEKALAIMETLAAQDPRNVQWQGAIATNHSSLGDVANAMGEVTSARDHYERALAIMETLAAQDPRNAVWQDAVVGILQRLTEFHRILGDKVAAEACGKRLGKLKQAAREVKQDTTSYGPTD